MSAVSDRILQKASKCTNGVYFLSKRASAPSFEKVYLESRKAESRVYSDDLVRQLPYVAKGHPQFKEWQSREKSMSRFLGHLRKKNASLTVLELGCGNGWFSSNLAQLVHVQVVGVDINLPELEQAARLFGHPRLHFAYWDIFDKLEEEPLFDVIVLNSSVQYFRDLNQLLAKLFHWLKRDGEIHLLDSPIYKGSQVEEAKKRSAAYYQESGSTDMAEYYHHHTMESLMPYRPQKMYDPGAFSAKVRSTLGGNDTPFPWVMVQKVDAGN